MIWTEPTAATAYSRIVYLHVPTITDQHDRNLENFTTSINTQDHESMEKKMKELD